MIQIQKSMREAKQAILRTFMEKSIPGWRRQSLRTRLPAGHAGRDCSARRHIQGDPLSVLQE